MSDERGRPATIHKVKGRHIRGRDGLIQEIADECGLTSDDVGMDKANESYSGFTSTGYVKILRALLERADEGDDGE